MFNASWRERVSSQVTKTDHMQQIEISQTASQLRHLMAAVSTFGQATAGNFSAMRARSEQRESCTFCCFPTYSLSSLYNKTRNGDHRRAPYRSPTTSCKLDGPLGVGQVGFS